MKKIFLFVVFISIQLFSQNTFTKYAYYYSGTEVPFNPLAYDVGNTYALYDADLELTTSGWADQISTNDISFVNSPTVVSDALNGHQAIRFDGVNEQGKTTTPVMAQPYTIYLVYKSITWQTNDRIFDDGITTNDKAFIQFSSTPYVAFGSPSLAVLDPSPAVGDYLIMTLVGNSTSSKWRVNNGSITTVNTGTGAGAGIAIGANRTNGAQWWNGEIAYLIIRKGADDLATQNKFVNFFKSRFGI